MIVLGIDPGLAILGWGVLETDGHKLLLKDYGTVRTEAGTPLPLRLRAIQAGVQNVIAQYRPDEIAFEELFFARNVTTALQVGAARGAAVIAAVNHTENLYEYTPMQIKQAVAGYGKADKKQMQSMVKLLLSMEQIPAPDDAADALAVAITHAHTSHSRHLFKMK